MKMQQLPTLYAAIESEVVDTEKAAVDLLEMVHSKDAAEQQKAMSFLNAKFALMDRFLSGLPVDKSTASDVGMEEGQFVHNKSANTAVSPNVASFVGFDNWTNTLGIDTAYMPLFVTAMIESATEAHINDWNNILRHKQYDLGAPIESQAFSTDTASRFGRKRYGGGSFADRSLLGTQSRYTLSNLMRGHQLAELRLRADAAYTAIAAVSPNGTTAFTSSSIIESLNAAYVTLIQAMSTAGYQVTASTPAYFLCHFSQAAAVNAALRTIQGEDGNNILLEYPIQPIYTANSNWPSTFSSNISGMLIVPELKNIWVNFQAPRIDQTVDAKRDGLELVYQYYFNFNVAGGQCQIVNIA